MSMFESSICSNLNGSECYNAINGVMTDGYILIPLILSFSIPLLVWFLIGLFRKTIIYGKKRMFIGRGMFWSGIIFLWLFPILLLLFLFFPFWTVWMAK